MTVTSRNTGAPGGSGERTRIEWISIEGFKSIERLERLELGDVSVLVGANGAGKSNLFEFFQLLGAMVQPPSGGLRRFVAARGGASTLLRKRPWATSHLFGTVCVAAGDGMWLHDFVFRPSADDSFYQREEHLVKLTREGSQIESLDLGEGRFESGLSSLGQDMSAQWLPGAAAVAEAYKGTKLFHFADTGFRSGIRLAQSAQGPVRMDRSGASTATVLYRLQALHPEVFAGITATVRLVAPYLAGFTFSPEGDHVRLEWYDQAGARFGPHQLSDGTLRAIGLITLLMLPAQYSPAAVLIDEPELGLHPAALGVVADLMKAASADRQVVAATQSPSFIQHFRPDQVVVVEQRLGEDGSGASSFERLDSSSLASWLEDYNLGQLYEMNVTGGGPVS